ncbi:hypothetical protein BDR05DRAFT_999005 [Suillus weaverae]|nr:hypothetical protein BDR05DRAFT_999005 [Suillus weaverae]
MERVKDVFGRKTISLLNTLLLPSFPSKPRHPQSMQIPMLPCSDPSSVSTSARTLAAIQDCTEGEEGGSLLDALISALIKPVPIGVDGEMEKDDEFQENVVK